MGGKRPTPEQHAELRRLLNEAMDAGAVGWAAQQLVPGGSSAVQCDYDGSPMISDMLPDSFYVTMAKAYITSSGSQWNKPGAMTRRCVWRGPSHDHYW